MTRPTPPTGATPKGATNVTVIGAQWGDEGKGKVVDWLSERADLVVRFQGGNNAGHTLLIDGVEHRLSLLPAAVVRPEKIAVISGGVVLNPWAFLEEVDAIRKRGIDLNEQRLWVDPGVALILPVHGKVDRAREAAAGVSGAIGTTGRGIGPAYEDRVGRRALRLCDLANPDCLGVRLKTLLHHNNALLRAFNQQEEDEAAVMASLLEIAPKILPYARSVPNALAHAIANDQRILFEGAQGVLLDLHFGTYPYVTSSHTLAAQAAISGGLAIHSLGKVLGIAKAYATRVGAGPFPSELKDKTGEALGVRGHEFGTVTGRKRRCGWLDVVALRHAVAVSGIDGLVLTKIDVLDGFEEICIATAYENSGDAGGEQVDDFHAAMMRQGSWRAVYEHLPGWQGLSAGLQDYEKLPAAARAYIARIEELVGVPVWMVSTSPRREDMIVRNDPYTP
ncbi:MAG: adenylosuccinate synthase [Alphaproteobacteria bacterium]